VDLVICAELGSPNSIAFDAVGLQRHISIVLPGTAG
jgi:hypothetical protein